MIIPKKKSSQIDVHLNLVRGKSDIQIYYLWPVMGAFAQLTAALEIGRFLNLYYFIAFY